jgi:hypothetical protein
MPLREAQTALARWIRAPEGVAQALVDEDRGSPQSLPGGAREQLERLIRSTPALDAVGRLEIYANAYFHRILGVLAADYPALQATLGEDLFHDLVTSYLLVEPSRHPSLRYAGLRLPDFVAVHEAAAGIRERAPWASDLAAFEWTRAEVFDASDRKVLAREDLASMAPEDFAALPLHLGPWVIVRSFDHPVDRLWRAGTRKEPIDSELTESKTRMIVWRQGEAVLHRRLESLEEDALAHVQLGAGFADLCEWASSQVDEGDAPALAARWLEQWLADELLMTRG